MEFHTVEKIPQTITGIYEFMYLYMYPEYLY